MFLSEVCRTKACRLFTDLLQYSDKWLIVVNFIALINLISGSLGIWAVTTHPALCLAYKEWLYTNSLINIIMTIPMILFYNVVCWLIYASVEEKSDTAFRWGLYVVPMTLFLFYLVNCNICLYRGIRDIVHCHDMIGSTGVLMLGYVQCIFYLLVVFITMIRVVIVVTNRD